MSKYGCGIKVHFGEISYEILCSKHTLARNKVSQNSPKLASKGSVVLYDCNVIFPTVQTLCSLIPYFCPNCPPPSQLPSAHLVSQSCAISSPNKGEWRQQTDLKKQVELCNCVILIKGSFFTLSD